MEFYYGISNTSSLYHFGTKEHSGRYKWGSGDRPYQRLEGRAYKTSAKAFRRETGKEPTKYERQVISEAVHKKYSTLPKEEIEKTMAEIKKGRKQPVEKLLDMPASEIAKIGKERYEQTFGGKVAKVKKEHAAAIADKGIATYNKMAAKYNKTHKKDIKAGKTEPMMISQYVTNKTVVRGGSWGAHKESKRAKFATKQLKVYNKLATRYNKKNKKNIKRGLIKPAAVGSWRTNTGNSSYAY